MKIQLHLLLLILSVFVFTACGGGGGGSGGNNSNTAVSGDLPGNSTPSSSDTLPNSTSNASSSTKYLQFESPQTNPIRISIDGKRLFAVNTAANRVSIFSLEDTSKPKLLAEIPVGIEPVSVWPVNKDELWVVNHVSDSISVVDVQKGIVTDTINTGDEPSDIIVAGEPLMAYVSVSRSNQVRVYDLFSHFLIATISLQGEHPRALAASKDNTKVYVAFALSGNGTTIIPRNNDPKPPAESAINGLPTAPRVGLIVDAKNPTWSSSIKFNLLDHDVAEISTLSNTLLRYYDRVGTVNLGLAVNTLTGALYVANTEALNLTFYEPNLRGHFVDNRITRITTSGVAVITNYDLNPNLDYKKLPNTEALGAALAQPTNILYDAKNNVLWVAAFGTDRVAKISVDGAVLSRIEVGSTAGSLADPKNKRGPRGLALNATENRLYVQNRISNTITTIDTQAQKILSEVVVGYDPTPITIKQGRGYLYDAKLSGNGTASCASCHVDGAVDNLAWNLGNPNGKMTNVTDPDSGKVHQMHPLKGPMTTQTLAGTKGLAPFHWRGDAASIHEFNRNFDVLLGGSQLAQADMQLFSDFIETFVHHPNPNLQLDRSLATSLNGFNPTLGLAAFQRVPSPLGENQACASCHSLPAEGFKLRITEPVGDNRAAKVPLLGQVYKKTGYQNSAGAFSTMGFGQTQDGAVAHQIGSHVSAFQLSWDTGTAPSVGYTMTVGERNLNIYGSTYLQDWGILEDRAKVGDNQIQLHGIIDAAIYTLKYDQSTNTYRSTQSDDVSFTREQLLTKAKDFGAIFTVMGVLPQ